MEEGRGASDLKEFEKPMNFDIHKGTCLPVRLREVKNFGHKEAKP